MSTVVPTDSEYWVDGMPLDAGGSDASREFVLMLLSGFIEKVDLIGGGDGDGGVDSHVADGDANNLLVALLELLEFDLRKEAHALYKV